MYSQGLDAMKAEDVQVLATSREKDVDGDLYGTYLAPLQRHYYYRWGSYWAYHLGCLQVRCPKQPVATYVHIELILPSDVTCELQ